jgi:hypothetical protein
MERERILSNSFCETSVTPLQKLHKHTMKKENYRPISLMNTNAKFLNEMLTNQSQQHVKRVIYCDQVGFIPRIQGWYNTCESIKVIWHINRIT